MKLRDKAIVGLVAGAGAAYALKTYLRSRRRIDLAGRVVVVTGGDGGLGIFLAKEAASRGAKVVLAARNAERLAAAVEEVRAAGARDVLVVPTDVSDRDQANHLIAEADARFGGVDVLINNAGIIQVGPVQAMTPDDFEKVLDINYRGAFHTTAAALPVMRRRGSGRIGFVSSIGGRIAVPHLAPYTVSKFALTGLIKSLRVELARENIFVTGIYPGMIRTGGHSHAWFKGDAEKEYAWFAFGDTIPGLAKSAEATASQALTAIQDGDPEAIIGVPTRIALAFDALFPEWMLEINGLVDRALPAPANLNAPAVQGQDLAGKIPSFFNRLIPGGARPGEAR